MPNQNLYGFIGLEHLFGERVNNANIAQVNSAIDQSLAEYNRQLAAMTGELFTPTTEAQRRFSIPGSGTLQPLDEWGNPLPVRPGGFYDVGFPIQGGGTAFGTNRVTRALMTVEEVQRLTADALQRDRDWLRRHVLAALLDNTAWTFADPDLGNLTVQPLALASDNVVYPRTSGASATDTHHIAQAATIADGTNPIPLIREELDEHPGNAGPYVLYIPSNLRAAVTGLTAFLPVGDPNIMAGSASDTLQGSIDRGPGSETLGYVDGMWVVEWPALPSNYVLGVARGADSPPLAMRQYPAAELQGLFRENHSPDGNLLENRFIRYAGFGALNRTAAVVYFVAAGDTTYDIPDGFATPLAV